MPNKKDLSLALLLALFSAAPMHATWAAEGEPIAGFGDAGLAIVTAGDPKDDNGDRVTDASWQLVPNDSAVDAQNGIVIGGFLNRVKFMRPDPDMHGAVMRLTADGHPDVRFGNDPDMPGVMVLPDIVPGTREQRVEAVHLLDDGSILVAGTCTAFGPTTGFVLRLFADGSVDRSFGRSGALMTDALFHALAVDSHGEILVGGEQLDRFGARTYRGLLARYDAQGTLLSTSTLYEVGNANLGYVLAMQVQPDDKIVVAGTQQRPRTGPEGEFLDNYDLSVARFLPNGELDPEFAGDGWLVYEVGDLHYDVETIGNLELDADGSLVFAAQVGMSGNGTGARLGRLLADGTPDVDFGDRATPGFSAPLTMPEALNTLPSELARSLGGQWLLGAGYYGDEVFNEDFLAARFTHDGRLDRRFGQDGIALVELFHGGAPTDDVRTLVMHDDRPVLIGASVRIRAADGSDALLNPAAADTAAIKLEHDWLFTSGF
jgi:uncharacterized delta-60 repeat protein